MANRQTRWLLAHGRGTKNVVGSSPARAEHIDRPLFHGAACNSANKKTKPRDSLGKLRTLSSKRVLDKRITAYAVNPIYAH